MPSRSAAQAMRPSSATARKYRMCLSSIDVYPGRIDFVFGPLWLDYLKTAMQFSVPGIDPLAMGRPPNDPFPSSISEYGRDCRRTAGSTEHCEGARLSDPAGA